MEEKTIFLDSSFLDNKAINILFTLQSILFLISGAMTLIEGHQYGYLTITAASIFLLVVVSKFFFQNRFDRKYFRFTATGLEYKESYFHPSQSITWSEIEKVKFIGHNNIIIPKSQDRSSINIKSPFAKYDHIRSTFKQFTNHAGVQLDY